MEGIYDGKETNRNKRTPRRGKKKYLTPCISFP
jgi:hypothetical protein